MSNEISTSARFSNRVKNYVRYRPDYPKEVVEFLEREIGLSSSSIIADIGSGTGISSKLFLDAGCTVYGVEPNETMREAADEFLKAYENFKNVSGTAENTMLENESVDFVVASQAFHWFDAEKSKEEFRRILKPNGCVILIWNERQLDTTPFLCDYEKLLLKHGTDYEKVRHDQIEEESLRDFFTSDFNRKTFPNAQHLDYEGVKGRILSSSYMPSETHPRFQEMAEDLKQMFARHQEEGKISILYDTNVFYGQI